VLLTFCYCYFADILELQRTCLAFVNFLNKNVSMSSVVHVLFTDQRAVVEHFVLFN